MKTRELETLLRVALWKDQSPQYFRKFAKDQPSRSIPKTLAECTKLLFGQQDYDVHGPSIQIRVRAQPGGMMPGGVRTPEITFPVTQDYVGASGIISNVVNRSGVETSVQARFAKASLLALSENPALALSEYDVIGSNEGQTNFGVRYSIGSPNLCTVTLHNKDQIALFENLFTDLSGRSMSPDDFDPILQSARLSDMPYIKWEPDIFARFMSQPYDPEKIRRDQLPVVAPENPRPDYNLSARRAARAYRRHWKETQRKQSAYDKGVTVAYPGIVFEFSLLENNEDLSTMYGNLASAAGRYRTRGCSIQAQLDELIGIDTLSFCRSMGNRAPHIKGKPHCERMSLEEFWHAYEDTKTLADKLSSIELHDDEAVLDVHLKKAIKEKFSTIRARLASPGTARSMEELVIMDRVNDFLLDANVYGHVHPPFGQRFGLPVYGTAKKLSAYLALVQDAALHAKEV